MSFLSIVIAAYNEPDLQATINSIRSTAPSGDYEIVVVDDCSPTPIAVTGVGRTFRTLHRIGVGPARHLGALHAQSDHLLFVDAHMRFTPGWYEAAMKALGSNKTVHCGVCLGLGFNGTKEINMDVTRPNAEYHGATWNFFGPDRKNPREMQVFETVWAPKRDDDDYELSGIMGACYFVPRDWYLKLNCGRHLVSYGCDEQELALKTWLAGGQCRMLKGVRIGHMFREAKKRAVMGRTLYNSSHFVVMNKIFLILTILPKAAGEVLLWKLRQNRDFRFAMKGVEDNWPAVECERVRNASLFTRDFSWFLSHFGISFPSK